MIVTKKGQAISYDFIIALSIFFAVVVFSINVIKDISEEKEWSSSIHDMSDLLKSVSDKLLKSPGIPKNWNETNVVDIGWAEEYPLLNKNKLASTLNISYVDLKKAVGVGLHEILINISYYNNTPYYINGVPFYVGRSFSSDVKRVFSVKRLGVVEENNKLKIIKIDIYLWDENVM